VGFAAVGFEAAPWLSAGALWLGTVTAGVSSSLWVRLLFPKRSAFEMVFMSPQR